MSTATAPAKSPSTGLQLTQHPRQAQFKQIMEGQGFQNALRAALPRHVRPDRLIRVTLAAMTANPDILECDPNTVILSIMRAASMGLEPDGGPLGQGYLVPFWNGKRKCKECQFVPGFRGLAKLARNSGEVQDIWAKVVYRNDDFEFDELNNTPIRHKRDYDKEPGEMIGAYAAARFRDGYTRFEFMPAREILSVKKRTASKTREGEIVGPWKDHEAEMWKKTVVRRLSKMLPLSAEIASVVSDESDGAQIAIPAMSFSQLPAPEHEVLDAIDGPHAEDASQVEPDQPENQDAEPAPDQKKRQPSRESVKQQQARKGKSEADDFEASNPVNPRGSSLIDNAQDAVESGQ